MINYGTNDSLHRCNPNDTRASIQQGLAAKGGWLGGVHPNDRGHALFAARIIPQAVAIVNSSSK